MNKGNGMSANGTVSSEVVEKPVADSADSSVVTQDSGLPIREKFYVPMGITSFDELDVLEEAIKFQDFVLDSVYAMYSMVVNVFDDPGIVNKRFAVAEIASQLAERIRTEIPGEEKQYSPTDLESQVLAEVFIKQKTSSQDLELSVESQGEDTILFKSADGETYYFYGRPTNMYRDRDVTRSPHNGGEIIASYAHQEYVDYLDKNPGNAPQLWVWHEEDSAFLDDDGVPVIAQWWDFANGFLHLLWEVSETQAEGIKAFSKKYSQGMSHLSMVLEYDEENGVIEKYRMRESSILPVADAANQGAGFELMEKDAVQKGFSPRKRDVLLTILGDEELVNKMEANAKSMENLLDAALQSKQADPLAQLPTIHDQPGGNVPINGEGVPVTEPMGASPAPAAVQSMLDAKLAEDPPGQINPAQAAQAPAQDDIPANVEAQLVKALEAIVGRIEAIEVSVSTLQKDQTQIAEENQVGQTVAGFLAKLKTHSVVGTDQAHVPSTAGLARQLPVETPRPSQNSNHALSGLVG